MIPQGSQGQGTEGHDGNMCVTQTDVWLVLQVQSVGGGASAEDSVSCGACLTAGWQRDRSVCGAVHTGGQRTAVPG